MTEETDRIKEEIANRRRVLKQLEGVYKTTRNGTQKKRVAKDIENLRNEIQRLKGRLILEDEDFEFVISEGEFQEVSSSKNEDVSYVLLHEIPVNNYREDHHDGEMDAVISYISYYEQNYLPILSEYYIKLDFNHSLKRDAYYPQFMEMKKILKEYDYELDVIYKEQYNRIASYRDRSVLYKIRQRYFFALDSYFKDLKSFLTLIVDDCKTGGSIILNPYDSINLSEFESNRRLDGYSVIDALDEIREFADEIVRYLGLPKL